MRTKLKFGRQGVRAMDTAKTEQVDRSTPEVPEKPIVDQMTDLAAAAAGALTETAVRVVAKKTKKAVVKRIPSSIKKAGDTVAKAAKASKKTAKKATKKAKKTAKKTMPKKAVKKSSKKSSTKGKKSKRGRR
jgi:hypothetical protein